MAATQFIQGPSGHDLAYAATPGTGPTVVWLGGFHSDMTGTKAVALEAWAQGAGRSFLRVDYSGHGQSGGRFEDGTIGQWRADTLAVLDACTAGPLVLVGSSMGGWMALLAALARPEQIVGMVLVAPAPDFTEDLMWAEFPDDVRGQIMDTGSWPRPSAYGEEPYPITRQLIEDGRQHLLLGAPIPLEVPIHILHGQQDADVPWQRSLLLMERLSGQDVAVTFVKDGDHRLSTPRDIALLTGTVQRLLDRIG
jgi:pimeloyl-ACP methyl ester carboxylesterase